MQRFHVVLVLALGVGTLASEFQAQQVPSGGPYKVLKTVKVGGEGGFDYIYADSIGRRLYVPRNGPTGRVSVFDLDTLAPVGEVPNAVGHGVIVDSKSHHGFLTSSPIIMFDSNSLATIKSIDVQGSPDGIFFDAPNQRLYDLSHRAPNVTVIDTTDGSVVGTIDLGGAPEQGVSDGRGHVYIDVEDKGNIAVVDAKTLAVTAHYDLTGSGGTCAGLAIDIKNRILFSACRNPQTMVILDADNGKVITTLPIGNGTDGAVFNPNTMEAFSSHADGTLTIVKELNPTSFVVEQNVQTMVSAKTLTLDSKTNDIFLIAAEFGPPPVAPPAGTPPGRPLRGQMLPGSFSILVVGKK
jgi:hypothetical protein